MANGLPTYSLPNIGAITTSDSLLAQTSGSSGDVGLLTLSTLINTFFAETIENAKIYDSTIALYESMGWTPPS